MVSDSATPMECSTPGLPVHHQLPEFAQTPVHRVGDAIQPSHPCRPLLLLPSIFASIRVFSIESPLPIRWPKDWSFSFSIRPCNEYSGLISCKIHNLTQPSSKEHCCPPRKSSQAVKSQPEPKPGRRVSHKVRGGLNTEISELDSQTWKAAKWGRYPLRVWD